MFLQILNHLCNMLIKSQSNNYQRNQTVNHRDMMMDHGKSVLGSTRPRKKKVQKLGRRIYRTKSFIYELDQFT